MHRLKFRPLVSCFVLSLSTLLGGCAGDVILGQYTGQNPEGASGGDSGSASGGEPGTGSAASSGGVASAPAGSGTKTPPHQEPHHVEPSPEPLGEGGDGGASLGAGGTGGDPDGPFDPDAMLPSGGAFVEPHPEPELPPP